eukprot:Rhum_TRINITY_DN23207_c0_g1::Rhum_TRINITY_DN23207_c0_g1_i1::g.177485::m.177485
MPVVPVCDVERRTAHAHSVDGLGAHQERELLGVLLERRLRARDVDGHAVAAHRRVVACDGDVDARRAHEVADAEEARLGHCVVQGCAPRVVLAVQLHVAGEQKLEGVEPALLRRDVRRRHAQLVRLAQVRLQRLQQLQRRQGPRAGREPRGRPPLLVRVVDVRAELVQQPDRLRPPVVRRDLHRRRVRRVRVAHTRAVAVEQLDDLLVAGVGGPPQGCAPVDVRVVHLAAPHLQRLQDVRVVVVRRLVGQRPPEAVRGVQVRAGALQRRDAGEVAGADRRVHGGAAVGDGALKRHTERLQVLDDVVVACAHRLLHSRAVVLRLRVVHEVLEEVVVDIRRRARGRDHARRVLQVLRLQHLRLLAEHLQQRHRLRPPAQPGRGAQHRLAGRHALRAGRDLVEDALHHRLPGACRPRVRDGRRERPVGDGAERRHRRPEGQEVERARRVVVRQREVQRREPVGVQLVDVRRRQVEGHHLQHADQLRAVRHQVHNGGAAGGARRQLGHGRAEDVRLADHVACVAPGHLRRLRRHLEDLDEASARRLLDVVEGGQHVAPHDQAHLAQRHDVYVPQAARQLPPEQRLHRLREVAAHAELRVGGEDHLPLLRRTRVLRDVAPVQALHHEERAGRPVRRLVEGGRRNLGQHGGGGGVAPGHDVAGFVHGTGPLRRPLEADAAEGWDGEQLRVQQRLELPILLVRLGGAGVRGVPHGGQRRLVHGQARLHAQRRRQRVRRHGGVRLADGPRGGGQRWARQRRRRLRGRRPRRQQPSASPRDGVAAGTLLRRRRDGGVEREGALAGGGKEVDALAAFGNGEAAAEPLASPPVLGVDGSAAGGLRAGGRLPGCEVAVQRRQRAGAHCRRVILVAVAGRWGERVGGCGSGRARAGCVVVVVVGCGVLALGCAEGCQLLSKLLVFIRNLAVGTAHGCCCFASIVEKGELHEREGRRRAERKEALGRSFLFPVPFCRCSLLLLLLQPYLVNYCIMEVMCCRGSVNEVQIL